MQTAPLAWEPPDTPAGVIRVQLKIAITPGTDGTYTAQLEYVDGAASLTRYYGEGTVQGGRWSARIATATPPEVHDLPLGAGIVANSRCFCFKTQESVVHGFMRFSSASPITVNTILATLPPGYRPSSYLEILLSTTQNSIGIHTNGNIILYGAVIPANQVCFFSFPSFVGR